MDFLKIAQNRQSCRNYDESRPVAQEQLDSILEAARLAPSACNSQPYHFTVCRGQAAKDVAAATMGMGMNKFASQAPVMIVVSEESYNKSAGLGARLKGNDYRYCDCHQGSSVHHSESRGIFRCSRKDNDSLYNGRQGEQVL